MASKNEVNTPLIITIGAVSGIMLIVIMVGLESWFKYEEKQELAEKWDVAVNRPLIKLTEDQTSHIDAYRWADSSKKVAMIPVDKAIEKMVAGNGTVPCTMPATAPSN